MVTLAGRRVAVNASQIICTGFSTLAAAQDDSAALAIHLERGAVNLPDFGWARQLILSVCVSLLTLARSVPETIC